MSGGEKLAYFLDEEALRTVFPDWPAEMGVVLCLDEQGGYEALLHHRDEARAVLRRVASVFGAAPGGFRVAPEVEGYPTRRVLFSEEQQLLSLLAGQEGLPDLAVDYAQRRRFGGEAAAEPVLAAEPRHRKHGLKGLALPKARRAEPPVLPPGYTLTGGGEAECRFLPAEIAGNGARIRVTIEPGRVRVQTRPVRVAEVGFRDDFARFVLPRTALEGWRPGEPAVLDIAVEHFPAGLAERLSNGSREAEVTVTRRGVFVTPGARMPATSETEPEPEPAAEPVRRWPLFTPGRAAVVALAAVGALTGTVVNALREPPRAELGAAAPVAEAPEVALLGQADEARGMELLTALAREEARGALE